MKIEDKYFTPSIEDIRIGYEFEQSSGGRPGYPDWVPNCRIDSASEIEYIESGEWVIRVPYLAKEQIEAEGWKFHDNSFKNGYFTKTAVRLDGVTQEFELKYDFDSKVLVIDYDCGDFMNCGSFDGLCKDINTFRYICKLLNV